MGVLWQKYLSRCWRITIAAGEMGLALKHISCREKLTGISLEIANGLLLTNFESTFYYASSNMHNHIVKGARHEKPNKLVTYNY